jgi:aminoglycoside 3-N-acetyltransferase
VVVTEADIEKGLRDLGLRSGDMMIVHSSLSSFGHVEGGAETVIEALMETVGKEGTILMPAFAPRIKVFDPSRTRSRMGKITEVFRYRKDVPRSVHPTHSYAAWGKRAGELVKDHVETHGIDSPLGKLAQGGGYVLMLGAPVGSNTAIHVAETVERLRCLGLGQRICRMRTADGKIVEARSTLHREFQERKCPLFGEQVEEYLRDAGQLKEMRIGNARARLMKAWDVIEAKRRMIRQGYKDIPPCRRCTLKTLTQKFWDDLAEDGD